MYAVILHAFAQSLPISAKSFRVNTASNQKEILQPRQSRRRDILIAKGMLLILVAGIVYWSFYNQPALRYRQQLYPLTESEREGQLLYRSGNDYIEIIRQRNGVHIIMQYKTLPVQTFRIAEQNGQISVLDKMQQEILKGYFANNTFYYANGAKDECYEAMREKAAFSDIGYDTLPQAVEAVFLYQNYPNMIRGGERAPALVLCVIVLALFTAIRLDAGAPWERSMKYSGQMLKDWKETSYSHAHKRIRLTIAAGWWILVVILAIILLYDVLCY